MRAELVATPNSAPPVCTWEVPTPDSTSHRANVQLQLRVSVVDDDPTVAEIVGLVLEESGFSVTVFTDPQEALISARQQPPHMVVTDLDMPVMSGLELCDRLRGDGIACGMLLFSGALSTVSPEQLAMVPGIALLDKPSNPGQLVSEVYRIATSRSGSRCWTECGLTAGTTHEEMA